MGALLTSIAQLGSQYGDATNSAREDKQKLADKAHQISSEDAYLQLAKQANDRQQQIADQQLKSGDLLKIGDRLWSVSQAKFVDTQRTDPMESLRHFVSSLPKEHQPGAQARAEAELQSDPNNVKGALSEVMRYADTQKAEDNRKQDAALAETHRREDAKTREQERRDDTNAHRKELEAFEKQMVDMRLAEKQKYMSPQERQMYDAVKVAEPMADRLTKFIEDNHLQDQNSYVFGDHSALAQHLRFYGYKKGVEPEKVSSQID